MFKSERPLSFKCNSAWRNKVDMLNLEKITLARIVP